MEKDDANRLGLGFKIVGNDVFVNEIGSPEALSVLLGALDLFGNQDVTLHVYGRPMKLSLGMLKSADADDAFSSGMGEWQSSWGESESAGSMGSKDKGIAYMPQDKTPEVSWNMQLLDYLKKNYPGKKDTMPPESDNGYPTQASDVVQRMKKKAEAPGLGEMGYLLESGDYSSMKWHPRERAWSWSHDVFLDAGSTGLVKGFQYDKIIMEVVARGVPIDVAFPEEVLELDLSATKSIDEAKEYEKQWEKKAETEKWSVYDMYGHKLNEEHLHSEYNAVMWLKWNWDQAGDEESPYNGAWETARWLKQKHGFSVVRDTETEAEEYERQWLKKAHIGVEVEYPLKDEMAYEGRMEMAAEDYKDFQDQPVAIVSGYDRTIEIYAEQVPEERNLWYFTLTFLEAYEYENPEFDEYRRLDDAVEAAEYFILADALNEDNRTERNKAKEYEKQWEKKASAEKFEEGDEVEVIKGGFFARYPAQYGIQHMVRTGTVGKIIIVGFTSNVVEVPADKDDTFAGMNVAVWIRKEYLTQYDWEKQWEKHADAPQAPQPQQGVPAQAQQPQQGQQQTATPGTGVEQAQQPAHGAPTAPQAPKVKEYKPKGPFDALRDAVPEVKVFGAKRLKNTVTWREKYTPRLPKHENFYRFVGWTHAGDPDKYFLLVRGDVPDHRGDYRVVIDSFEHTGPSNAQYFKTAEEAKAYVARVYGIDVSNMEFVEHPEARERSFWTREIQMHPATSIPTAFRMGVSVQYVLEPAVRQAFKNIATLKSKAAIVFAVLESEMDIDMQDEIAEIGGLNGTAAVNHWYNRGYWRNEESARQNIEKMMSLPMDGVAKEILVESVIEKFVKMFDSLATWSYLPVLLGIASRLGVEIDGNRLLLKYDPEYSVMTPEEWEQQWEKRAETMVKKGDWVYIEPGTYLRAYGTSHNVIGYYVSEETYDLKEMTKGYVWKTDGTVYYVYFPKLEVALALNYDELTDAISKLREWGGQWEKKAGDNPDPSAEDAQTSPMETSFSNRPVDPNTDLYRRKKGLGGPEAPEDGGDLKTSLPARLNGIPRTASEAVEDYLIKREKEHAEEPEIKQELAEKGVPEAVVDETYQNREKGLVKEIPVE